MEELRWALLIIGGSVLLGIYFLSVRNRRYQDEERYRDLPPITVSRDEPDKDSVADELASMNDLLAEDAGDRRHNKPPARGPSQAVQTDETEWSLQDPVIPTSIAADPMIADARTHEHDVNDAGEPDADADTALAGDEAPARKAPPKAMSKARSKSKTRKKQPKPSVEVAQENAPVSFPESTPDAYGNETDDAHPDAGEVAQAELELDEPAAPAPEKKKSGRGWGLFGRGKPEPEPEPVKTPELILMCFVVARPSEDFHGTDIRDALEMCSLRFGRMNIFHRTPHGGTDADPVFSVADMLEPGTLDVARLDQLQTPGITFFMRLPGPQDGFNALDDMLATARDVAQRLGGEVRDERRSVLTKQTVEHMRERILEHRRQVELAHRKAHGHG